MILHCSKSLGMTTWLALIVSQSLLMANDWTQFRGPGGTGIVADAHPPTTWSEKENLLWKVELPGAGASSPVVLGDRVFVTCYSGYGVPKENGGDIKALQRHVLCVDRLAGKTLWSQTIPGEQPEDVYQGFISEHGYASNTPVTDGERLYCFFGKSGVFAYDLAGKQLWQTGVGKESSNRHWGSGASLLLYKNLVIVNAAEESRAIIALDKSTGKQVWKAEGSALELAYGTPALVSLNDQRVELVVAVPGEVWGLNPDTGKMQWLAEHQLTGNICPSIISQGETVFVFGGFRSSGSFAIRAGGKGDVTKTHIEWTSRNSSYVATPILHEGHLYWIDDRGQAFCSSAKTGELVYRERVPGLDSGGRPVYASPVLADDKIYVVTRWNGTLVLPAKPEYKILATNHFADISPGGQGEFNATPALCNQQMILRSNRYLYCVGKP